ncbi:MAG: hypothetical protein ABEN55_06245, partial [Bradymonadaceae bacterium]
MASEGEGEEDDTLVSPAPGDPCTPGRTVACPCPSGPAAGMQTCRDDGTFSACRCPDTSTGEERDTAEGGARD